MILRMSTSKNALITLRLTAALAILTPALSAFAQSGAAVHTFNVTDGYYPQATPLFTSDGTLFGTCPLGSGGSGNLFAIGPGGQFTILHVFGLANVQNSQGQSVPDGVNPRSGVVLGPDGLLYGTTAGQSGSNPTVYKIKPDGSGYVQVALLPLGDDVETGLISASDGNLYGTAGLDVYRVTPIGSMTVIHRFTPATEGAGSAGELMQGTDGYIYGGCETGGSNNKGTIWRMTTAGAITILHQFSAESPGTNPPTNPEGALPYGGMAQAGDGFIYGTTTEGGLDGHATLYRISPAGTFEAVASMGNGGAVHSSPMVGSDGNLYFGNYLSQSIFEIALPSYAQTQLHQFTYLDPMGIWPYGAVAEGPDGSLYGSCKLQYDNGWGTIYALATHLPLNPVLSTLAPATYPVGSSTFTLTLNGSRFENGDTVKWGSNSLTTTYVSPTQLTAVVPSTYLATPGTTNVTVRNASNTRSSNGVPFVVSVPNPVITGISPGRAFIGSSAVMITVTGTGFVNGCQVCVDGSPRPTTFASRTSLVAAVLASDMTTSVVRNITVKSQGIVSNVNSFRVQGTVLGATYATSRAVDGTITFVVTFVNVGNSAATSTKLTSATLNSVATSTTLPITVGTVPSGGVATTTLTFPASAAPSGAAPSISLGGTITAGSFTMKQGVTVP